MSPQDTNIYLAFGWIGVVVLACAILLATALASHFVVRAVRKATHVVTEGETQIGSILDNILRACIWVVGACAMLYFCFDFNASVIWGALGVGGIAISLGAQTTISNLIGGFQLSFSKEVAIGDWVSIGSVTGQICDITWRKLMVKDTQGNVHHIPGSLITSTTLTRHPDFSRLARTLVLKRECDIETIAVKAPEIALAGLEAAGMDFDHKLPLFSVDGTELAGISCTMVLYGKRDFRDDELSNAAMEPVLAWLAEQGALAEGLQ